MFFLINSNRPAWLGMTVCVKKLEASDNMHVGPGSILLAILPTIFQAILLICNIVSNIAP